MATRAATRSLHPTGACYVGRPREVIAISQSSGLLSRLPRRLSNAQAGAGWFTSFFGDARVCGQAISYFRVGNATDVTASTSPGTVLMGGGTDVDAAFQWMCSLSGNG